MNYSNASLDYQTSTQSITRIDGNSNNNVKIELPIVLTDDEAKQLIEKLVYVTWMGRSTLFIKITLDNTISISDVINVTSDGIEYTARITAITFTSDYIMEVSLMAEDSNLYESVAIGQDSSNGFKDGYPKPQGPTKLECFNSPTLSNSAINSLGIYYSSGGYTDAWKGCNILKSKDNGQTYENINASLIQGVIGRSVDVLQDSSATVWDLTNSVTISIPSGNLTSISKESVLNGKNYVILGSEVFQFADVINNGDETFTLYNLLRGRRGTEWATKNHSADEVFVLLNPAEIQFSFSTLNTERLYNAITLGQGISTGSDFPITCDGTNLKPFSVINTTHSVYDLNHDFIIKWARRDRYISGYFRSLPMSEAQAKYRVKIYDSDQALIRDQYITYNTYFEYTAGLRILDGLFGDERDTFTYEINQVSDAVGDGYSMTGEKLSEYKPSYYSDDFTGIDGSPPSYSFYSLYLEGNVISHSEEILDNQLNLVSRIDKYGYTGIEMDQTVYGDFDISFDFTEIVPVSNLLIGVFIGSVFIYTKSVYNELFYRDFDNGTTIKLLNVFPNHSGSLRILRSNGVISYMYKNTLSSNWTLLPITVSNYTGSGQKAIIKMGKNYKFTKNQSYLIDNLEVYI